MLQPGQRLDKTAGQTGKSDTDQDQHHGERKAQPFGQGKDRRRNEQQQNNAADNLRHCRGVVHKILTPLAITTE